ncbi:MAG: ATP synthase F1 subunit delta [Gemmataceae bacterium]|nr:ATP synthase F1 subunit delta [Gemmataceae bacterium]
MAKQHRKLPAVTVDVSARRIARVYAEALLNAAEKQGQAEDVVEELESLVIDLFAAHPQLETLFSSAALGRHARAGALEKAFSGRASDVFFQFLMVLNEHERLELIRAIAVEARELMLQRSGQVRVSVTSAVPLPESIHASLLERIRAAYQLEPLLEARVNPELLGGMKIRIRDLQFDATVSTVLENLNKDLLARSSHEIQSRRDSFSSADGN